jgi:hypothetical protein
MSNEHSRPVPPDAVRVWRGFRSPSLSLPDFFTRLNTVFVPATVEMQTRIGLDAYIPTVPAGFPGKPDGVPDETAVLFWDSQQTYEDGFRTLAVRTYTLTHGAVYVPDISRADFPVPFAGTVAADQPCYLVDAPADWMRGTVTHLVGGRPEDVPAAQFLEQAAAALADVAADGLAGAVFCAGSDYLVYWELRDGPASGPGATLSALRQLTGWNHLATAAATSLPAGLWDVWPGMDIVTGDSLNLQFQRGSDTE